MTTVKRLGLIALCALMVAPAFGQTRNANPQAVGLEVLIPDTPAFVYEVDNAANWEPYADVMGDGSLIFVCNTMEEGGYEGTERAGVVVISPDLTINEYAGYYADDGTPWIENMDDVRQDGNPPQIAGDRRPGMSRYIVGNECTPFAFGEFRTDDRWTSSYASHMYCVQAFDLGADGPAPLFNVIDPFYGGQGLTQVGKGRAGGVACLDNGNWVSLVEDRSGLTSGNDKAPILAIVDDSGAIVKAAFESVQGSGINADGWDGLSSRAGGFSLKVGGNSQIGVPFIQFYDNDGNETVRWHQDTLPDDFEQPIPLDPANNPGEYSTTISGTGRGDGNHTCSGITSKYIYYTNKGFSILDGQDNGVYVVKIDTETGQTVKEAAVYEAIDFGDEYDNMALPNRCSLYVDENDNVTVAWSDTANTGDQQVLARIFNSDLEPVTESFLVFQSSAIDGAAPTAGVSTYHVQVGMTQTGILFTARTNNVPKADGDGTYPLNTHLFTVIANPLATDIGAWEVY